MRPWDLWNRPLHLSWTCSSSHCGSPAATHAEILPAHLSTSDLVYITTPAWSFDLNKIITAWQPVPSSLEPISSMFSIIQVIEVTVNMESIDSRDQRGSESCAFIYTWWLLCGTFCFSWSGYSFLKPWLLYPEDSPSGMSLNFSEFVFHVPLWSSVTNVFRSLATCSYSCQVTRDHQHNETVSFYRWYHVRVR